MLGNTIRELFSLNSLIGVVKSYLYKDLRTKLSYMRYSIEAFSESRLLMLIRQFELLGE